MWTIERDDRGERGRSESCRDRRFEEWSYNRTEIVVEVGESETALLCRFGKSDRAKTKAKKHY